MSDLLEFGKTILKNQPFSALLGTELDVFEPGNAVLTLQVREELKQQHGFVHGGVVSYLADNALTYAGGSVLGDSVTSEYKINYLRPAIGEKLVARATVLSSGKNQAVCQCSVFVLGEGGERTVAVAQGTINKVEPKSGS
ncbi:PaaI family thioesterase [Marinobacter nanhaiticus D15-8W]|uniref:PaaI family thioesterase n=1 Tax=Marinobacter nanhaiticus D15-8W TaxID=626887 RepID=N6W6X4_9GAMM|nr:PaaI family thioesterase [Marinobacter nanhaiticus]ENO16009.1 PaaI family thioesterase [Marinobacter nanhaiticus D15-8W]BES73132.1 PaaI family thioesterase [Marinobacter nanhaiticus D15-8W]